MSLPYVNVAARLKACLFITALLGCTLFSQAQFRRLGFLFSENLHGGTTMFGNTLMGWTNSNGTINPTAMNGNAATGNSFFDNGGYGTTNMQYIDVDGDTYTVEGAGTRNSSSADLILPAGNNTIRFARLYWGRQAATTQFNMADPANQTIKIRKGTTGVYTELAAAQIDRSFFNQGQIRSLPVPVFQRYYRFHSCPWPRYVHGRERRFLHRVLAVILENTEPGASWLCTPTPMSLLTVLGSLMASRKCTMAVQVLFIPSHSRD